MHQDLFRGDCDVSSRVRHLYLRFAFSFDSDTHISIHCSAQPGGKLSQIHAGVKRKLADYQSSNTNAASTLPTDKKEREDLAWIMCVLMMATRQLALLNKTGQVDFEINSICKSFTEWVRIIVHTHFHSFFGGSLFLSYDRVIAGFTSRQVATTFMSTCARHVSENASMTEANTKILMDMETAPLTLHSCNLAICNALTHLVDTNLILVNQIIREKLGTPVLPPQFLFSVFGEEQLDTSTSYYEELFSWLSHIVQSRQNDAEFIAGYVAVPKLGTMEDYTSKEGYLESFFGVAKNNFFTYMTAIRECTAKTFDLSGFLSMDGSMIDFGRFISRIGVGGDGIHNGVGTGQQNAPNSPFAEAHRSTYIFTHTGGGPAAPGAPADGGGGNANGMNAAGAGPPQRATGPARSWVNIIQHLLVTSIQGRSELHADNMFTFGANLTELMFSKCTPVQAVPSRFIVYESFKHFNDEVLPLRIKTNSRPEYFVRTIKDSGALECGASSELPAMLGPHPIEDVMHLGSWIQLYTILHSGGAPKEFQCFPDYNGRIPELVCGRTYPLLGLNPSHRGTICLCPDGRGDAARITLGTEDGPWRVVPLFSIEQWYDRIKELKLMVAPLVFRHYAVFRDASRRDAHPTVAVDFAQEDHPWYNTDNYPVDISDPIPIPRQFLGHRSTYTLAASRTSTTDVHFVEAHARLLPLGTYMLVETSSIQQFGLGGNKRWIRGSLRYPDEEIEDGAGDDAQLRVYVTIRLRTRPGEEAEVRVVYTTPDKCRIFADMRVTEAEYSTDAIRQSIRIHARGAAVV